MHRGWKKLWVCMEDSPILLKPTALQLFTYFICKSSRSKRTVNFNGHIVKLEPGELITGRKSLAEKFGVGEQKIRTALDFLKNNKTITIKPTNLYSVVALVNWEKYQPEIEGDNQVITNCQPTDNQQVTNCQPTDNQVITTNRECKNVLDCKNVIECIEDKPKKSKPKKSAKQKRIEEINICIGQLEVSDRCKMALSEWAEHKEDKKSPLTARALKMIIKRIGDDFKDDDHLVKSIEWSISNGYAGVYTKKDNNKQKANPKEIGLPVWMRG